MKYFVIFSILCTVGVQALWIEEYYLTHAQTRQVNRWLKDCAEELGTFPYKYQYFYILNAYSHFYPGPKTDKITCLGACFARKFAEFEGFPLPEHIFKMIDIDYLRSRTLKFGKISKALRDEMKLKAEYCHSTESDECGFYKCLDIFKSPFSHITARKFKPLYAHAFGTY